MFFCDCDKKEAAFYCRILQRQGDNFRHFPDITLLNVQHNQDLVDEVKQYGIRGVFYSTDPLEKIEKGLRKVLAGEYWISRELLARSLRSVREDLLKHRNGGHPSAMLTMREQEILKLIATGLDNQGISERLFISPNTVKTHVSNIYKKIDATNRVQAIIWASENDLPYIPGPDALPKEPN